MKTRTTSDTARWHKGQRLVPDPNFLEHRSIFFFSRAASGCLLSFPMFFLLPSRRRLNLVRVALAQVPLSLSRRCTMHRETGLIPCVCSLEGGQIVLSGGCFAFCFWLALAFCPCLCVLDEGDVASLIECGKYEVLEESLTTQRNQFYPVGVCTRQAVEGPASGCDTPVLQTFAERDPGTSQRRIASSAAIGEQSSVAACRSAWAAH